MRKIISKIKNGIEGGARRICAPMAPGTRILVIVILVAAFAVTNFYIIFRAIYNIGREDKKWEQVDSEIKVPDMLLEHDCGDEESKERQREMEEFFNEQFNPGRK